MKTKIPIAVYFILYFFLLTGLYHYKIKTYFYWSYISFLMDSSFDFSILSFALAILIFVTDLYFLLKANKNKLVFIVLSIFFLLLTIPSIIAFTSEMYPFKLLVYNQILFFVIFFLSKFKLNFNKIPVLNKKQALYLFFTLITIGILPYLMIYGPHINLKNLVLLDVYETRRTMDALSNPYFGYTYSVFTKILIPLFIVLALELKNKFMVGAGVLYLVLFYLFGAHKTVYVALLIVFIFYKLSFLSVVKKILLLSNITILIAFVMAFVGFDYVWILTFRRIHFLPTLLDICYLDFFKGHPIYWSDSVLRSLIDYPFKMNHANIIGKNYFNQPHMAANNGLISDGFMNFGTYGVLINIFLVSTFFMLLNSLKIPSRYFGLFILVIFSFISSSTFTVFLTHGGFVLMLISIFILNEKKY